MISMLNRLSKVVLLLMGGVLVAAGPALAQPDTTGTKPFDIDVNKIHWRLRPSYGGGGMSSQFAYSTVARNEETEPFYYPPDRWYSNMLFQFWNFPNFSDRGYLDASGERQRQVWRRVGGDTDVSHERRRYRPPKIVVDGRQINPPYIWDVDPDLPADYVGTFEDVYRNPDTGYGGIRSKVRVYAFANQNHQDYILWKVTRIFTGETRLAREIEDDAPPDEPRYLPDQTVKLWWDFTMGMGPTKGGESESWGFFPFEGQDDKEDYFRRSSELVPGRARNELTVGYFWDDMTTQSRAYDLPESEANPTGRTSDDDTGDPNRVNGGLTATQIPGFTILYADQSTQNHVDDPSQPVAAPHGNINEHFYGQLSNFAMRDHWIGRDRAFPGPYTRPRKGSMRAFTVGPYDMTVERGDDDNLVRADSFTVVYAIAVGDAGYDVADSLGRAWYQGKISDQDKRAFIPMGKDSLFKALDRANWAWNRDLDVPAPLPPPDIEVTSGPGYNTVEWTYPEERYWNDANTGVNDFYAWRVYRKEGGYWVNDPDDNFQGQQWEQVYETTDPTEQSWRDDTAQRGVSYYYAVTAVDDGSQNTDGLFPGQKLESSRYENETQLPAISFRKGLSQSGDVRVVPNPATLAAGDLAFPGESNKILFVNLPYRATLSIYTETGELVKRIEHTDGSADESWDQLTDGNQYVSSGIYILTIHNAEREDGSALSKQYEKFVIVR